MTVRLTRISEVASTSSSGQARRWRSAGWWSFAFVLPGVPKGWGLTGLRACRQGPGPSQPRELDPDHHKAASPTPYLKLLCCGSCRVSVQAGLSPRPHGPSHLSHPRPRGASLRPGEAPGGARQQQAPERCPGSTAHGVGEETEDQRKTSRLGVLQLLGASVSWLSAVPTTPGKCRVMLVTAMILEPFLATDHVAAEGLAT